MKEVQPTQKNINDWLLECLRYKKALSEISEMTLHRHTLNHAVSVAKKELARGSDER